jgi:hypothetical protein
MKKNKENKKREKKRVYIKKRGVRKEGSESEPASSTHIKGYLVCTPSSYGITLQQKNISPLGSTQPCSRALAKPCITLIHCQLCIASLAAPTHAKKRNAPLTIRGFTIPPLLAHAHMQRKETYFAPPIPKRCANGSCHQGLWFLHTSHVYDLALIIRLSRHGVLLRFSPHQKGRVMDNQMQPCHHCSNSKTSIHIRCW